MTEIDATLPRETGQEKATAKCSNCGDPVGVIETPYGSTAPAPCPKCYPAAEPARQQADTGLQRQVGTQLTQSTVTSVPGTLPPGASAGTGEGGV